MSLEITQMLLPSSKYWLKAPYEMDPDGLTIHETGNIATAMAETSFMIGNNSETGYHFAIDDVRAVQGLPLNRNGYHAGDGINGRGNRKTIGLEHCFNWTGGSTTKNSPKYNALFWKAIANGVELAANLFIQYPKWGVPEAGKNIWRHYDWSGKNCPQRMIEEGYWPTYVALVKARYLELKSGKTVGKWSTNDFLKLIKTGAIKSWEQHKVLPSLVGAQAALESGWGKSGLAKDGNNLFGIKAGNGWKGAVYTSETKEFINGEWIVTRADFRAYDNWADSVADHGAFFTSTDFRKDNYKAVIGEKDYKKAVAAILEPVAKSGYATDPNYANKIINIIEEWDLAEWDVIAMGPQAKPKPVNPVAKPTTTLSGIVHTEKENGRFQVGKTLYVFDRPDETSKHVATYKVGDEPVVYHTIHYGNGYLWLQYTRAGGKGEGYIACRTYTNGKLGPMFGEILPDTVAKKTYVKLSATVSAWRIYPLGVAPVAGNEKGFLNPKQFAPMEYEVLGYQDNGKTAIIQTQDFGKGKIFLDSDATFVKR